MYVSGRGDYAMVSGNSLIEGLGSSVPQFNTTDSNHGDLVVAHSEFITDVIGNAWALDNNGVMAPTSTFDMKTLSLNPALSRTFPFLSQIAQNFEEYEFIQMIFTYKPKVSSNLSSTDGQVGSIMMYTDYNSNDEAKRSKQNILQAYGHSSDMITKSIMHGVECDPTQLAGDGHHFTRVKPPTGTNNDYNDFDAGLFQMVVANTPEALSNQVIGELWVSYNVKLKKARTYSVYGLGLDRDEVIIFPVAGGYGLTPPDSIDGQWNSIGAKYQIASVVDSAARIGNAQFNPRMQNHAIVEITLPQSFSGDLVVSMFVQGNLGATSQPFLQGAIMRPQLQGNIVYLHCHPAAQSHHDVYESATATDFTPGSEEIMDNNNRAWVDIAGMQELGIPADANSSNTAVPVYHQKLFIHAEMAERAIDNIIYMGIPVATGRIATVDIEMSRFNSRESTGPDPAFQLGLALYP